MAKKRDAKLPEEQSSPAGRIPADPTSAPVVAAVAVRTAALPKAVGPAIRCNGYKLTIFNTPNAIRLDLVLEDQPDQVQYQLRINNTNDRTELVQKLGKLLSVFWPAYDFNFTADDQDTITDIV